MCDLPKGIKGTRFSKNPPNSRRVTRPSHFGNIFKVAKTENGKMWAVVTEDKTGVEPRTTEYHRTTNKTEAQGVAVNYFNRWLNGEFSGLNDDKRDYILQNIESLKGVDLICSCAMGTPCHRNTLILLANWESEADFLEAYITEAQRISEDYACEILNCTSSELLTKLDDFDA